MPYPVTIAGLPPGCRLLNNSDQLGQYTLDEDENGLVEKMNFLVPWEQFPAFRLYVKGYTTGTFSLAGASITRHLPMISPYMPYLYAVAISSRGIGADQQVSPTRLFPSMVCTVTFSTLPYTPSESSPYLAVKYRASTSIATIPGANLAFATGETIDHDYGITLGQFSIEVTSYALPDVSGFLGAITGLAGQVNSDTITLDGYDYAPGYLLLPTFDGDKSVDSNGALQQSATVSLIYRSIPWNSDVTSTGAVSEVLPNPYGTTAMGGLFS